MRHYMERCEHGTVGGQCRCPSKDKAVRIIPCPSYCKGNPAPRPVEKAGEEPIYWEDDFDGAVAQIVRDGEQMSDGQTERFILKLCETILALRAELAQAKARVQSLLMRHNANHGDGGSITCEDCVEARAILARQKEGSK